MKRVRAKTNKKEIKNFFGYKGTKIGLGVLFGTLAIVFVLFLLIYPGDNIAHGVKISGMDVGGMNKADAKAVTSVFYDMADTKLTVLGKHGGRTDFCGGDIGLIRDDEKTVEAAYQIGRGKGFFENVGELFLARLGKIDVGYQYSYNEDKLYDIIYMLGISQNGELKNYTVEYGKDTVRVSLGTSGQSHDLTEAMTLFDEAIKNEQYEICVELKKEDPKFPSAKTLYDEIYIAPKNAEYRVEDGMAVLDPEIIGREIDPADAETQIEAVKSGDTVTIKLIRREPEITWEMLNKQMFGSVLGTYTTSYSTGDRGRASNVETAARAINGKILLPGQEFSFNKVVGRRTIANGYKEAPVFQNGETVQGTGGGVCQVSSTLYCAVLYSDLKITERRNHSMTVAYVPRGQDATVSYGSIDFRFLNDTENPIKIEAIASGGKLTVSLCSAAGNEKKTVKVLNNTVATRNIETEESLTDTLAPGKRKVVSQGKTGYTVETYKKVYIDGTLERTEFVSRSVYKMVPEKVLVGAEPIVEEPTEDVFGDELGEGAGEEATLPEEIVDEQAGGTEEPADEPIVDEPEEALKNVTEDIPEDDGE